MKKIGMILDRLTTIVAIISFIGVSALVLLNVADVIATKVFVHSIKGCYETSQLILMCAVFASFAYGQSKKTHINMTLFANMLPRRIKFIPYSICSIASAVVSIFLVKAMWKQSMMQLSGHATTDILRIPLFPFYIIGAVAMGVFALALIYDTIVSILAIFNDEYAEMVTKDWS